MPATGQVGPASRAAVYLLGTDTPLRLDENTVGRFEPPPEPGSGMVELVRGAIYFLSEVRRTLTIRTPYVNAGIEGTEVYLRVREPRGPGVREAELIVLEGRVALTPGAGSAATFPAETAMTGERVEVSAAGSLRRTVLPSPGGTYGALRQVAVGELSWTLFYPDILTEPEAGVPADRRGGKAARGGPSGAKPRIVLACGANWRNRGRLEGRAARDHSGGAQGRRSAGQLADAVAAAPNSRCHSWR